MCKAPSKVVPADAIFGVATLKAADTASTEETELISAFDDDQNYNDKDKDCTPFSQIRRALFESIDDHRNNTLQSFDFVASNSCCSADVKKIMGGSLMNSYCIGLPGERFYGGCSDIDKIETIVQDLACQVYGAKYCEVLLYIIN